MSPFRIYKNFLRNPAHHEMASVLVQVVLEITPAPVGCVKILQKSGFILTTYILSWTCICIRSQDLYLPGT